MFNTKDLLLICMLLSYSIPILYVYFNYVNNNSVSNVISDKNCNNKILVFMIIMGIFTILYELQRKDNKSLLIVSVLLLGIYGIINVDETYSCHYVFATIIFLSIIYFMIHHYNVTKCNMLCFLLCIQILSLLMTLISIEEESFFSCEVFYIFNFAIYYLYLHKYNT